MSLVKSAGNIYFVYQFLKKLVTPFKNTDAFKLGIIDEKGKVLKKRSTLKTSEEKEAYTLTDTMIFNLKKLLEKIPGGRLRIASFAAALFLLKEDLEYRHYHDLSFLQEEFYKFMKEKETEVNYMITEINEKKEYFEELSAGSGAIAGIGVEHPTRGGQSEPPGKSKVKRGRFAGQDTFIVDPNIFMKSRMGKKKYHRYENYVGNDEVGEAIRAFGRANPSKPIILQDSLTGAMLYLKYGKDHAFSKTFS